MSGSIGDLQDDWEPVYKFFVALLAIPRTLQTTRLTAIMIYTCTYNARYMSLTAYINL